LDHELEEGQHDANEEGKWADQLQANNSLKEMLSTEK